MKRILFFVACLLAASTSLWAYDFSEVCTSGQTLYYNYVNTALKEVEVTSGTDKPTGDLVIPATVIHDAETYKVIRVGTKAFQNCEGLTSVVIPEGVTHLFARCFEYCTGLTSVTLPSTLENMDICVFNHCESLLSISIPEGVTWIGTNAMSNCYRMTEAYIPGTVRWGGRIFEHDSDLVTVTLEEGIVSIGQTSFQDCKKLTSIDLPSTITRIENSAFIASGLTSFTMPENLTYMGSSVFKNTPFWEPIPDGIVYLDNWCLGWKNERPAGAVSVQEGTKGLANQAFSTCNQITSLAIPASVQHLGIGVISGCPNLTTITIAEDNPYIFIKDGVIYTSDTTQVIFANINLTTPFDLVLPATVTYIKEYAFSQYHGLNSITLPASLLSVGDHAFSYCDGLTGITCKAINPPALGNNVFYQIDILPTLYVAQSRIETYTNANKWNAFTIEAISETHTVTAEANDTKMGSVTIQDEAENYLYGTLIVMIAAPAEHYHFVSWNDGKTSKRREFYLKQDTTFTAIFAPDNYTLTVDVNDEALGSVEIAEETESGEYPYQTQVTLTAVPVEGYHLVQWSDLNEDNPRVISIDSNITLTAYFVLNNYTLSIGVNEEEMGSVEIEHEARSYAHGTEVTFRAIPATGFHFVKWSDENTDAERTITMTDDVELTAIFEADENPDAIAEAAANKAQIFGSNSRIVINNAANNTVDVFDIVGKNIVKARRMATNKESIAVPHKGIYLVRMGNTTHKVFVK